MGLAKLTPTPFNEGVGPTLQMSPQQLGELNALRTARTKVQVQVNSKRAYEKEVALDYYIGTMLSFCESAQKWLPGRRGDKLEPMSW